MRKVKLMQFILLLLPATLVSAGTFTDNSDGTVSDSDTALMWQAEDDNVGKVWESALSYCEDLSLAGHTDWRLPDIKELRSIVDFSTTRPAINTLFFPGVTSLYYWSSTTSMSSANTAWRIKFDYGTVLDDSKTLPWRALCVRS